MKLSQLFSQTRREAPAESDLRHYRLLVRAGYIQPLGGGTFALLPLGLRAVKRMAASMVQELGPYHPQEIDLPLIQSLDLWQSAASQAGRLGIRPDQNPFPAPSQDPAILELIHSHLRSYRQLPAVLYYSGAVWNPSPAGSGLLRSRTPFSMEVYALETTTERQAATHENFKGIFDGFFQKLSLPVIDAEAAPTVSGSRPTRQWFLPMAGGSASFLLCAECGYAAAGEAARFRRSNLAGEAPLALEKVATPECPTIESLARFLQIPESRTAKAVFLVAERRPLGQPVTGELVFCVVRGDRPLNETALLNLLQADSLRPAEDAEIRRIGAVPGYASPVGLKDVRVIVDREIPDSPNLVSGANEAGYHLMNVNYGRDFQAGQIAEIAQARAGDACPECGRPLLAKEGAVLAELTVSGPEITRAAGCTFVDDGGKDQPVLVSKYSLSLTRILAALAELHNDDYGLKLPPAAAPFPVHLVMLPGKTVQTQPIADNIYTQFIAAGLEPLYDDRLESTGVKFNDADLIGLPLRLTVGERGLQKGGVEFKCRAGGETGILPLEGLVEAVRQWG